MVSDAADFIFDFAPAAGTERWQLAAGPSAIVFELSFPLSN